MESFALGMLSGLLVGLALGWFAHILAIRRTEQERSLADATEMLDRCLDVTNARVKYILAYHRRAPNRAALNEEHKDLKRRYRWADPEVILAGIPEWEQYHAAEVAARLDKHAPLQQRVKRVETASYALIDAIVTRRAEVRKYKARVGET